MGERPVWGGGQRTRTEATTEGEAGWFPEPGAEDGVSSPKVSKDAEQAR